MKSNTHLYRRRDAAKVLAVSESQVLKYERAGLLEPIALPGIRAVRYNAEQVHRLAQSWVEKRTSEGDE